MWIETKEGTGIYKQNGLQQKRLRKRTSRVKEQLESCGVPEYWRRGFSRGKEPPTIKNM